MYLFINFKYTGKNLQQKLMVGFIISLFFLITAGSIFSLQNLTSASGFVSEPPTAGTDRSTRTVSFTEASTGLPNTGEYNFIAFGDINGDSEIDIAFGGEDYQGSTEGLYAYTGNGGASWSSASTGLWTGNSWGGLALVDADEDGYTELYATDEKWGTGNNSGLKVWEYRSGSWTDSSTHVSTPFTTGRPDNVILTNITGDNKIDMVLCTQSGLKYYQNNGGNPVTWNEISTGLPSSSEYTALVVADMNKDGLKDIVASDYFSGKHLFVQLASGDAWTEYSSGLTASGNVLGMAVGDVNNDTHMDIIFGTDGSGLKCWLGNSGGGSGGTSFSWTDESNNLATNSQYTQIQLVDIDLDGDLDLIAPVATDDKGIEVYFGNGNTNPGLVMEWTLASNTNLVSSGNWYGSNCYDINKDGYLDIVVASWGNGVKAYLNDLGQDLDLIPPGAIIDLTITNVTKDSITINWSAPADNDTDAGSGPVQNYDVRYSTNNIDLGNWDSATQSVGVPFPQTLGTPQGLVISGLSFGTTYFIAIRSLDERPNISPLSNVVNDTTLGLGDSTLPGQITDLEATYPTSNSINLTWSAPADNGSVISSGSVSEYEIRYHTVEITNVTWVAATIFSQAITPQSPGIQEEIIVSSLQPNTTYYFAARARDTEFNWGWVSNSPYNSTLTGPDVIPPAVIDDLMVVDLKETLLNLTWTAPGDDGITGTATEYDIRYAEENITPSNWENITKFSTPPIPNPAGGIETFLVTGLQPNTTYYFAIITSDEVPNWSPLSNIASETTLEPTMPLMTVELNLANSTINSGDSTVLIITVHSHESAQPIQDATVELSSDHSGLVLTPASGQTVAEGVLTVVVQAPAVTSNTEITIFANITKNGYMGVQRQVKITVEPVQIPIIDFNLQITSNHITFSKSTIYDGDEIKIYTNIYNLGPDAATGFSVRFLVDGNQLDTNISVSSLTNDAFTQLDKSWSATEGVHIVRIEIDPLDQDSETDASNNIAEKTITVTKKDTNGDGGDTPDGTGDGVGALGGWLWLIIIIVIVIIIVVLALIFGKRKRKTDEFAEGYDATFQEQEGIERVEPDEMAPRDEAMAIESPTEVEVSEEEEVDEEVYEEEFVPGPDQDFEPDAEPPAAEEPVPDEEPIPEPDQEPEAAPEPELTEDEQPIKSEEPAPQTEPQDVPEEGETPTTEENTSEESEKTETPEQESEQ